MKKMLIIKACTDCPHIHKGMLQDWCTNQNNAPEATRELSEVNIEAAIPDWCKLEDAP